MYKEEDVFAHKTEEAGLIHLENIYYATLDGPFSS
jgi:hypothetical protein